MVTGKMMSIIGKFRQFIVYWISVAETKEKYGWEIFTEDVLCYLASHFIST